MKKDSLFFATIYAVILIPIIFMLVMTGIAIAEEIPPESDLDTPQETSTPITHEKEIQPLVVPSTFDVPVSESTPTPEFDNALTDEIHTLEIYIPMKAGEERDVTVRIRSAKNITFELTPSLIVSDASDDNEPHDDWAWCFDEYKEITLEPNVSYEIKFELLPQEDVPAGNYEFYYELRDGKETVKRIEIHVKIYN